MNIGQKLFIIGAGAHVPYGMPTSYELKRNIKFLLNLDGSDVYSDFSIDRSEVDKQFDCIRNLIEIIFRDEIEKNLENESFFKKYLNESQKKLRMNILKNGIHHMKNSLSDELCASAIKTVNEDLIEFLYMFENSQVGSIDSFLSVDHSNEIRTYEIIGKVLIYYLITYYENYTCSVGGRRSRLVLNARNDDWIEALISKYLDTKDWEKFFEDPPGIITFNYDCIFEKKIASFLKIQKKLEESEILERLKQLNIIHVYGSINSTFASPIVDIKKERKQSHIFKLANIKSEIDGISIINRSEDFKIETVNFEKYKVGYFLGYGFDEVNNKILRSSFGNITPAFYTTNYGLSPDDKSAFKSFYNQNVFGEEKTDSLKLLKNRKII